MTNASSMAKAVLAPIAEYSGLSNGLQMQSSGFAELFALSHADSRSLPEQPDPLQSTYEVRRPGLRYEVGGSVGTRTQGSHREKRNSDKFARENEAPANSTERERRDNDDFREASPGPVDTPQDKQVATHDSTESDAEKQQIESREDRREEQEDSAATVSSDGEVVNPETLKLPLDDEALVASQFVESVNKIETDNSDPTSGFSDGKTGKSTPKADNALQLPGQGNEVNAGQSAESVVSTPLDSVVEVSTALQGDIRASTEIGKRGTKSPPFEEIGSVDGELTLTTDESELKEMEFPRLPSREAPGNAKQDGQYVEALAKAQGGLKDDALQNLPIPDAEGTEGEPLRTRSDLAPGTGNSQLERADQTLSRHSAGSSTQSLEASEGKPARSHLEPSTTKPREASRTAPLDVTRFVGRVSRAVHAAASRGGPIQLRLYPPELGSLRLEVDLDGNNVRATIETENRTAQQVLLENLPQLRERLAEQSLRVDHFEVEVRDQREDFQREGERRESPSAPEPELPEEGARDIDEGLTNAPERIAPWSSLRRSINTWA